jgi:hypothetical protein
MINTVEEYLKEELAQRQLYHLSFIEIDIIEWNEEFFYNYRDSASSDLSVDMEEIQPDLVELAESLANTLLLSYCVAKVVTSTKLAVIWKFNIDFETGNIRCSVKERRINDNKKGKEGFTIQGSDAVDSLNYEENYSLNELTL